MHTIQNELKRKIDSSDDEDDWEKEASHLTKKSHTIYEHQIELLNKQYIDLTKTNDEHEEQLIELEQELSECEQEEEKLIQQVEQLKHNYETLKKEVAESKKQKELEKNEYFEKDRILSATLEGLLDDWQEILCKEITIDDTDIELEELIHPYKITEFDIIDLTAQIEGYKKRIESLNMDTENLPAVPPKLPELKLSIEEYQEEIEHANTLLEKLEKDTIRPCMVELADCKINYPQEQLQKEQDIQLMEKMIQDLDLIYKTARKQRAQQQILQYLLDKQDE